ncbi:ABC transporter substrate-binding protein [Crenobacter sp. SG2303]|uniref:ABC transporter substrate-binding protein n=1 Tax=Crenobacter oryzisoli TaxID=3056844 RepID=A0ABT7XMI7_9NEIS|nr:MULTISPECIES: ABC transporter substrate-binding protein [unclassified Crenobacter]MDN0074997.1 ABC transporter substrate-binding protein [Crenobacter sp. SG2303]MDN0081218.1 ABC transporter substrate-binding protein [Crenobacter sp. SG2305]
MLRSAGRLALPALVLATLSVCVAHAGGTLVYCSEGSPEGFDPAQFTTGTTFHASSATIYNRLVDYAPGSTRLIPSLATRWQVSQDGLTYTFTLRPGVKYQTIPGFAPSRDFNADDVLFTFNRLLDKNLPFRKAYPTEFPYVADAGLDKNLDKVEKVDDLTVRFVLKKPDSAFLPNLATDFASILSAEYAAQLLKQGRPQDINLKPVGTGPFVLKSYQKDATIRYARHPGYWRANHVQIDNLVFAITPDSAVRAQRLKAGECQLADSLKPDDIAELKKVPQVQLISRPGMTLGFLAYNTQKKYLDQANVRRALDMAIDKPAILASIYQGSGIAASNPIPPGQWGYKGLKSTPYNPAEAQKLLHAAGVPQGYEVALWAMPVQRPYNPNARRMAEMIQSDWAKVGIKAKIVSYEWGEYNKRIKKGEHDAALLGWSADNGDPDNWLGTLLSCDAIGGSNSARWCNKDYDALVTQARGLPSMQARSNLYARAQLVFGRELPFSPIAYTVVYKAARKNVQGVVISPLNTSFEDISVR